MAKKIAFPEEKTALDTLYAKALDSQADGPSSPTPTLRKSSRN